MSMQSAFVALFQFSGPCSVTNRQKNKSFYRPDMILRKHVHVTGGGTSTVPLPSSFRESSTVTQAHDHGACHSSDDSNFIKSGDKSTQHTSYEQNDPSMFLELMSPIASAKPDQMSASSLAYLGDVLFELFVRSRYVWPSRRMSDLQNKVVSVVRGEISWECREVLHCYGFSLSYFLTFLFSRGAIVNVTKVSFIPCISTCSNYP